MCPQLDEHITKGSIKFQTHPARITLYNLTPNESRTQNSNFLLSNEPRAVSTFAPNFTTISEAICLAANGYTENGGTLIVCADIL